MKLRDLQSQMRQTLLGEGANTDLMKYICQQGEIDSQTRLNLYKNNIFVSLITALGHAFPMLAYVCGKENFKILARHYIRSHPPAEARLSAYGASFADFIQNFAVAVQDLPFLPDLARFEWASHVAYFSPEGKNCDIASLETLNANSLDRLYFQVAPSCQLVASDFPLCEIKALYEKNTDPKIIADRVEYESTYFLVHRRGWAVRHHRLDGAAFRFIAAIKDGHALEKAAITALAFDNAFDLEACLIACFQKELFSSFTLAESA